MPVSLASTSASAMHGAVVPIAYAVSNGSIGGFGFSNIPQNYQDLMIVINCRTAAPGADSDFRFNFNGDTSNTPYSVTRLTGNGSSASSSRETSASTGYAGTVTGSSTSSLIGSSIVIHVLNYANTSTYKTHLTRSAVDENGSGYTILAAGVYRSTNAITSFNCGNGYTIGSGWTAALYGVRTVNQ